MNVIGVDVGTNSVRLAIVRFDDSKAHVLASHSEPISSANPHNDHYEQSSNEIWQAICNCCNDCILSAHLDPDSINAIGFSSTCSMVIVEDDDKVPERDIIMWMDHRAVAEAAEISSMNFDLLRQFGGTCSPEFSLAKLVWLHRNERQRFNRARAFMELPDWLVYRCLTPTTSIHQSPRSLCSITCKWGYESNGSERESRWPLEVFESLGFDSTTIIEIEHLLGKSVLQPGQRSGYLSRESALELGLSPDSRISVGTSLIDAHAGALAMISTQSHEGDVSRIFCSLAGTSTCHMAMSRESLYTEGVWGPYRDVIINGMHLREAGQSLTGALIELCVKTHPDGRSKLRELGSMSLVIKWLDKRLKRFDTRQNPLHIMPNFHGNRSPLANPNLRGGIYGLSAGQLPSLDQLYVAVIESLAYETRSIVEKVQVNLTQVLVSGGLMHNNTFMNTLATVLQCPVVGVRMASVDLMVIGASLVARNSIHDLPLTRESVADIEYDELSLRTYSPGQNHDELKYHERKYKCFQKFVEFSLQVDQINDS